MKFFLGIDGGGTKTSCVIGDERSILGSGLSGPSNILRVGEAIASKSLIDAVNEACYAAEVRPTEIASTCVGIAGGARPAVLATVRSIVAQIISGDIEIVGDMVIARHAAFGAGPGIVVIAGTGSMAYGRNLGGETARAGGWGPAASDEGSGHWIGRAAVASILRQTDVGPEPASPLSQAIMSAWNCDTREALVLAANAATAQYFAELAPLVLVAATSGDVAAANVLRSAGTELATLAKIVAGRLFTGLASVHVAQSGGIFNSSELVRKAFRNELMRMYPTVVIQTELAEPVMGALELAKYSAGFTR